MSSAITNKSHGQSPADRLSAETPVDIAPMERGRGQSSGMESSGGNSINIESDFRDATSSNRRVSSYDHLNNRIFFRLFQLGNELQRQAVQQLGITTVQWAVLGALSQEKYTSGIPLSQLGDYLVVSRQNLDGVLKRLERDGLVQRVQGEGDKRARIVQLTPHGRSMWSETLERIYQFYDQAAVRFSFDERVALVHYLNELRKDLANVDLGREKVKNGVASEYAP